MTGAPYDLSAYGPTGKIAQWEMGQYNQLRDTIAQRILQQQQQGRQPLPTVPQAQGYQADPNDWRNDELIGAARFWGIPEDVASQIPRDHLVQIIQHYRQTARPSDAQSLGVVNGMAALGSAAVGALEAAPDLLHGIPGLSSTLGRIGLVHQSHIWMEQLEEGLKASTPESIQPVLGGEKWTGNLAALSTPAELAWNAAGSIAKVVPYLRGAKGAAPIVLAATQGAGTAAMLQGGTEEFQQDPGKALGIGAGLGVVAPAAMSLWSKLSPAIDAVTAKVSKAFLSDAAAAPQVPGATIQTPGSVPEPIPQPAGFNQAEAEQNAAALNKTKQVVESPDLPNVVRSTRIDEELAARSAMASNPGGTNVVQGVVDPAVFMQNLMNDSPYLTSREATPHIRFARPSAYSDRLDALLSDEPITDKMVKEYEKYGVYSGQSVVSRGGMAGSIQSISNGRAIVQLENTAQTFEADASNLMPSVTSPGVTENPALWENFQKYSLGKAAEMSAQLSGGRVIPEQVSTIAQQNLPQYMEDFMKQAGITRKGDMARVRAYFNQRFVEGFKALAPSEQGQMEGAVQRAQAAPDSRSDLGKLDDLAGVKGFAVTPVPGAGVELHDLTKSASEEPVVVKFDSHDAASKWLGSFDREVPDQTPETSIPIQTVGMHPSGDLQAPNLNGKAEDAIPQAIEEMGEGTGEEEKYAGLAAAARAARASGASIGELQRFYNDAHSKFDPARRVFAALDEYAQRAGFTSQGFTPFQWYNELSQANVLHQNYMAPMEQAAHDALADVRIANKRSGLWSQMYEIADPTDRLLESVKHGLNENEIAAFDKLKQVTSGFFQQTGMDPEREIFRYLPMIQKAQSLGDWSAIDKLQLNPVSEAFMFFARNGLVNIREMDPDVLMHTYIKSLSWAKNMEEPFSRITSQLQEMGRQVPEIGDPVNLLLNWAKGIKQGYHYDTDALLDATHAVAKMLINPNITRQEARSLALGGLNASYASMLGFRLDIAVRDAQRIWLALPRAGTDLISVMNQYLKGGKAVQEAMWDSAVQDGLVNLQRHSSTAPGILSSFEAAAFDPTLEGQTTVQQRALGQLSAAMRDALPETSPKLSPSYFYARQNEIVRMLVGTAGKQMATDALEAYRAAGPSGDIQQLLNDSKANTFRPGGSQAVEREFLRMVAGGDDQGAARFIGQQLADATNFRAGSVEGPIANRSITGKFGFQLGNYPNFYRNYLSEALRYGTTDQRVKTAAMIGTVSAALYEAKKLTGWNLTRLNPVTGLAFGGGPLVEKSFELGSQASQQIGVALGKDNPSGSPAPDVLKALGTFAGQELNPFHGIQRTVGGIQTDLTNTPNPLLAIARLGVTGEIGPTEQEINDETYPKSSQLQPQPNPVAAGRYGLPAGQVPPQRSIMPPELGGGLRQQNTNELSQMTPSGVSGGPGSSGGPIDQRLEVQRLDWDKAASQLKAQNAPDSIIYSIIGHRP